MCLDSSWPLWVCISFFWVWDRDLSGRGVFWPIVKQVRSDYLWPVFIQKGGGEVRVIFLGFMVGFGEKGFWFLWPALRKRDSSFLWLVLGENGSESRKGRRRSVKNSYFWGCLWGLYFSVLKPRHYIGNWREQMYSFNETNETKNCETIFYVLEIRIQLM